MQSKFIQLKGVIIMIRALKKVAVTFTLAALLTASSVAVFPASAAGKLTTNVEQSQTSFKKKWDKPWTFDCGDGTGTMTIGYDTWCTNEDYVKDFRTECGNHYAAVKNSINEISYTNTAEQNKYTGKTDIEHYSSPITYYAFWYV